MSNQLGPRLKVRNKRVLNNQLGKFEVLKCLEIVVNEIIAKPQFPRFRGNEVETDSKQEDLEVNGGNPECVPRYKLVVSRGSKYHQDFLA